VKKSHGQIRFRLEGPWPVNPKSRRPCHQSSWTRFNEYFRAGCQPSQSARGGTLSWGRATDSLHPPVSSSAMMPEPKVILLDRALIEVLNGARMVPPKFPRPDIDCAPGDSVPFPCPWSMQNVPPDRARKEWVVGAAPSRSTPGKGVRFFDKPRAPLRLICWPNGRPWIHQYILVCSARPSLH